MVASAIGMFFIFGFNFFTAIPLVLSAVGGLLAFTGLIETKQVTVPQSVPPAASPQSAPPAASPQSAPPAASPQSAPPAASPQSAPPAASPQSAPPAASPQSAPPAASPQSPAPAPSPQSPGPAPSPQFAAPRAETTQARSAKEIGASLDADYGPAAGGFAVYPKVSSVAKWAQPLGLVGLGGLLVISVVFLLHVLGVFNTQQPDSRNSQIGVPPKPPATITSQVPSTPPTNSVPATNAPATIAPAPNPPAPNPPAPNPPATNAPAANARVAGTLSGVYDIYDASQPGEGAITRMEVRLLGEKNIAVRGIDQDWMGEGRADDRSGYYQWRFADGRTGNTTFDIRADGALLGHVIGEGLDFRYVARRPDGTQPLPSQEPVRVTKQIGPSFDCRKAQQQPLAQMLCADPELSRTDLRFAQSYFALLQQVGDAGKGELKQQELQFLEAVQQQCGIPRSGAVVPQSEASRNCVKNAYEKQRSIWVSRLTSLSLEEANRPIERHIALQRSLQQLGLLLADAIIDGVYGTGTRQGISQWQRSQSRNVTGVLGDADAQALENQVSEHGAPMTANPKATSENSPQEPPPTTSAPGPALNNPGIARNPGNRGDWDYPLRKYASGVK
jgi:Putative peptidoglycan binding domain